MIEVVENKNGFSAVCEYYLVDKLGQHKEKGDYLYIIRLVVAEGYRHKKVIIQLIKQFLKKYPQLQYAYWQREKYDDRMCFHSRRKFEKLTNEKRK